MDISRSKKYLIEDLPDLIDPELPTYHIFYDVDVESAVDGSINIFIYITLRQYAVANYDACYRVSEQAVEKVFEDHRLLRIPYHIIIEIL